MIWLIVHRILAALYARTPTVQRTLNGTRAAMYVIATQM